jgi:signal transduction histidine kinase
VRTQEPYKTLYKEVWPGMRSQLTVPIIVRDHVIGALDVESSQVGAFGEEEKALLMALAKQAAIALEKTRLFREVEEARQKEAMAALGVLAGDVVHRMNSPLGAIRMRHQLLEEKREALLKKDQYLRDSIRENRDDCEEAIAIASSLRQEHLNRILEPIEVVPTIRAAIDRLRRKIPEGVILKEEYEEELPPVRATSNGLMSVFLNLIHNAVGAMPDGGELSLTAHLRDDKMVRVTVTDTGSGIPAEWVEEVFEGYLSTRRESDKDLPHGLGLYYSRCAVRGWSGQLQLESRVGVGTWAMVDLPVFRGTPETG